MNNRTLRQSLRQSATLLLLGQILYIVITLFHTGGEANNHPIIFAAYAASGNWVADHIGQFAAMALLIAGLLGLFLGLDGEDDTTRWTGRFGAATAIAALALYGALQAVVGVANQLADAAWVSAPEAEKAMHAKSFFERLIRAVQLLPLWQKLFLTLILLVLPLALAELEGARATLINWNTWRTAYFPTVAVIYIAAVAPWIWRAEDAVRQGLQPLLKGESKILIACGALAWLIYAAMGSARATALLHQRIGHEDPFDITPLEPVGRQGLVLAAIFAGAIALSVLFIYGRTMFWAWQNIVIYSVLVLALAGLQRLIGQTMRKLEARL